jgi:hypothetical protein
MSKKQQKTTRENAIQRRYWLFLAVVVCFLSVIPFSSALEFDNVKSYDPETKTITIDNAFGIPLIGDKIAEVKLETDLVYNVVDKGPGVEQLVAEFTITNYDDGYTDFFKELNLYDKTDNDRGFERDVTYKYEYLKEIRVEDNWDRVCIEDEKTKKLICEETYLGTHNVYVYDWKEIEPGKLSSLPAGNITIGLFTDVERGESVEWIPKLFGETIDEWAVWVEGFNVGLIAYYNMTDTRGATYLEPDLDLGACTIGGTCPLNETSGCLIGDCQDLNDKSWFEIDQTNGYFNFSHTGGNSTMAGWVKSDGAWGGDDVNDYLIKTPSSAIDWGFVGGDGHANIEQWGTSTIIGNETFATDTWHFIVVTRNNTHVCEYINLRKQGCVQNSSRYGITGQDWEFGANGADNEFDGWFDEWGFWNRSITADEMIDLYNGGAGLTYLPDSAIPHAPNVTILFPTDTSIYDFPFTHINYSVTSVTTPESCWYSFDNGEFFNSSFVAASTNFTGVSTSDGQQNLTVFCNNTDGTDLLNAPADAEDILVGNTTNFNATITPQIADLKNTTLYVWNSSNDVVNRTTNVISGNISLTTDWDVIFNDVGGYNWSVFSCMENRSGTSICNFSSVNRTFEVKAFIEGDSSFNLHDVNETSSQYFELNITTVAGVTVVSSNLNYNGTTYPITAISSGTSHTLGRTIDIPIISKAPEQNLSFNWDFTFLDAGTRTTSTSSTYYQNVTFVTMQECDGTLDKPIILNLSVYEENDTSQLVTADLDYTFEYYLGSGTVSKTNFSKTETEESSYVFCVDTNDTFTVNSKIDLAKRGFSTRNYNFILEEYPFTGFNKSIFLSNSTDEFPTNVIIEVKDQGLIPLEGYLVEIRRFFPTTNTLDLVESKTTDEFGQFVAKLIQNDAKYQFKFYNPEKELVKETGDITITCRSAICIVPFVIEEDADDFEEFEDLQEYTSTLTFTNITNTFTFAWDDNRGESTVTHRLTVKRVLLNGTTTVCNTTSTALDSALSCAVGDSRASYDAQAFRKYDGDERRIWKLAARVGETSSIYGLEGFIWVFILLMTMVAIGAFNPSIAIVLYAVGFVMMGLLGIIAFSLPIMFATLVLCIIFIWAIRN